MTTQKTVLMEEDGFQLLSQPNSYWVSWIVHKDCRSADNLDSYHLRWVNVFESTCKYCPVPVPESLLGVWKLHNYDNYAMALRIRSNQENFC